MRAPRAAGLAAGLALTLLLAGTAAADEESTPSRGEVREARDAARGAERDVATVQADLVLANQRLQDSAVHAAQAAEAWNGARYRLQQARQQVRDAERRAGVADADVDRQQQAYADALATSYQMAPELSALSAIVDADGIGGVVDKTVTVQSANDALDSRYDEFRASATLAEVARQQAEDARAEAAAAEQDARAARDEARAAADAANAEAQAVAQEKDRLIGELARLQQVSKDLAEQRQSALEQAAAEAAAEAAAAAAQEAAEAEAAEVQAAQQGTEEQQEQAPTQPTPQPAPQPTPQPAPEPAPEPAPQPTPPTPPAPSGGASAAVAFARAQIGEPYRWGAAGPGAWDCSGLTAGAWNAGGTYLPHYSVAQYEQSTPISSGSLRAGDLVFWGSSSNPSSIYHVALYAGGGTIIHAPRTGRPVTEESMYYWTPPNFFARP